MGIKFMQIKAEDQAMIRAFINRQLMQDLAGGWNRATVRYFERRGGILCIAEKKSTGVDRWIFL